MEENHTLCSKCRGWLGILGLFLLCLFSSCTKVLCPGYAPTFIIDDSLRSSMFSLFDTDGEPLPARRVKKDKHHLLVPISPSKRYKEMRLVRSKFIYPTAEDSTEVEDPEITASDVSDESEIEAEEDFEEVEEEEEDLEQAEEEEEDLEEAEEEEEDLEEVEEAEEEDLEEVEEAEEDLEEAEEEEEDLEEAEEEEEERRQKRRRKVRAQYIATVTVLRTILMWIKCSIMSSLDIFLLQKKLN